MQQPMHPGMAQSTAWSTTTPCAQPWLQSPLQQSVQQSRSGLQASTPMFTALAIQQAGCALQAVQHSMADGQVSGTWSPTVPQQPCLPQLTRALQVMVQSEQQNRQQQLLLQQCEQGTAQPGLLDSRQPAALPGIAAVMSAGHSAMGGAAAPPASDSLLSELQAQLQLRQEAAAATAGSWTNLQPLQQQQQQSDMMLGELHLLLPALHAEYRAEMQLMLRACQLASSASKHSSATGSTLLMNPAARDQLQRQVLANCNDKHAAVSAAFRQAARAVDTASSSGKSSSSLQASNEAAAGAAACAGVGAGAGAAACSDDARCFASCKARITQCLQQLRSCYQQELVAATSALFAICRGFGQSYALCPGASASIKAALAAAQQQHGRVEQLWQDVVLAAGDTLS